MSDNHTVAEKAARKLCCGRFLGLDEARAHVQSAIDEATKEQRERIDKLVVASRKLSNEVGGILGFAEPESRAAIGNTNMNVLQLRLKDAKTALAQVEKAER